MRAMLLHELGGTVTFKEVGGFGRACGPKSGSGYGVGLTVLIMKSTLTGHRLPEDLGHEVAGEVVEVGSEVRNVKAGTVVCHFYLTCKVCRLQEREGNAL
jgi:hypothetical protein